MTKFLLIRHGAHDLLGKVLAGRMPGVGLNAEGQEQAAALPTRLAGCAIHAILCSPMERTRETAEPLAEALGLEVKINTAFHEIDFGAWTSRTFAELHPDPKWQLWNIRRTQAQPPGGETMAAVQARFFAGLQAVAVSTDGQTIAIVSHGDPIKSVLLHVLGVSLDHMAQLEISPASVSVVTLQGDDAQVMLVNDTGLI